MSYGVEDRLQWSIDMQQQHALHYYRSHWDNIKRIEEVDAQAQNNEAMKRLDFSGIDKIIYTELESIHIAQRFRRMRNTKDGLIDPDFSIRFETYGDNPTEYQKLEKSYNGVGSIPQVYGFGITPYGRKVALDSGFKKFYLIDVDSFLKSHFKHNEVEIMERKPNGDGSAGVFFDIDDIKNAGCIISEWPDEQTQPDDPHDITNW